MEWWNYKRLRRLSNFGRASKPDKGGFKGLKHQGCGQDIEKSGARKKGSTEEHIVVPVLAEELDTRVVAPTKVH